MASSVPYAAPYTRTAAPARPALRINGPLARFVTLIVAGLLFYMLVQLSLASIASGMLQQSVDLEAANAVAQRRHDVLLAQAESYKSPAYIETKALERGYVPLTSIEFER